MNQTNEIKVGSRVIGTSGFNISRRMTVAEIRDNGRIYIMNNGAFLGATEIKLANSLSGDRIRKN